MKSFLKNTAIALVIVAMSGIIPAAGVKAAEPLKNSITVNGIGTVKAQPDIATIYLGKESIEADAKAAQAATSKVMDAVLGELKKLGIADADIQTTNIGVYPQYSYSSEGREPKITGYMSTNNVQVIVRDLAKVGIVIDAALDAGASNNGGISFSVSNPEKYYNEALKLAIKNANTKSSVLAAAIQITDLKLVSVTEQGEMYATAVYGDRAALKMDSGAGVPVASGQVEMTARVSVIYEY